MLKHAVATMIDYNYWANNLILTQAAALSLEQYTAPHALSWGSIQGTLVHTMGAEWVWRSRIQGASPSAMPAQVEYATLAALRERWRSEEAAMRDLVGRLTESELAAPLHYSSTSGTAHSQPVWQILLHVVNHGTQHRSEVAHFLTEAGQSPGDIDLILYARLAGAG